MSSRLIEIFEDEKLVIYFHLRSGDTAISLYVQGEGNQVFSIWIAFL